jgi:hypothetical protein
LRRLLLVVVEGFALSGTAMGKVNVFVDLKRVKD